MKEEFDGPVPAELQPYWVENMNLHSCQWWQDLWKRSESVRIIECKELKCHEAAWRDWLACDNDYARRDIKMMEAEGGNYFNFVSIIGVRS